MKWVSFFFLFLTLGLAQEVLPSVVAFEAREIEFEFLKEVAADEYQAIQEIIGGPQVILLVEADQTENTLVEQLQSLSRFDELEAIGFYESQPVFIPLVEGDTGVQSCTHQLVINKTDDSAKATIILSEAIVNGELTGVLGVDPQSAANPDDHGGVFDHWHLDAIQAADPTLHIGSAPTVIAILDTGIAMSSAFRHSIRQGYGAVGVDNYSLPRGHGTPIASIAAGENVGINPEAKLIDVHVCHGESCVLSDIIVGLCRTLNDFGDPSEETGHPNLVINMSFSGIVPNYILLHVINYAIINMNIPIVVSVGNTGEGGLARFPAAFNFPLFNTGLIAVGRIDSNMEFAEKNTHQSLISNLDSERFTYIDVLAPGETLQLLNPNGNHQTMDYRGKFFCCRACFRGCRVT